MKENLGSETARERRRPNDLWRDLLQDLHYGFRLLRRKPLLPALATLTLAVGIGGSAAIFTVVNGTILRPMMVPGIEQLVRIDDAIVTTGGLSDDTNMAPAFAEALLARQTGARQTAFSAVAVQQAAFFTWTGSGEPERLRGSAVSAGWVETLRVAPLFGRFFNEHELREGPASGRALIGYALWQRRFGGSSAVLGRTMILNGTPRTVVGVMPRGFRFPYEAEVWVPLRYEPSDAANHYLLTFARLREGGTLAAAQSELATISAGVQTRAAAGDTRYRMVATPLRENLIRGFDRSAMLLLAVSASLWLLACVNVAGLAVARLSAREGELVVRTALGATRWRQARQLLVEMLILVVAGGALGLGLAALATPHLGVLVPPVMSVELAQNELALDFRVLLFTVGVTAVAALAIAVLPALRASRVDLQSRLKDAGRTGRGRRGQRFGSLLVVAEVATAMVMLSVAAGILLAYERAHGGAPGYEPRGVLSFAVSLPDSSYPDPLRRRAFAEALLAQLAAAPGVQSAGLSTWNPPLDGDFDAIRPLAGPLALAVQPPVAHIGFLTPGAATALALGLVEGRSLLDEDHAQTTPAALVSENLARRLWPGQSALGERFRVGLDPNAPLATVVGVIRPVRQATLPAGTVLLALRQLPATFFPRELQVFVRAAGDPLALLPAARAAVASVDANVPLFQVARLGELESDELRLERTGAVLGSAFSGFGLVLAAIGVFGVLSNAIQARAREFALRQAIGATQGEIRRRILLQALGLGGVGVAVGLSANAVLGALLQRLVPASVPLDSLQSAGVAAVLLLLGTASALPPAWRAGRAEPAALLRAA